MGLDSFTVGICKLYSISRSIKFGVAPKLITVSIASLHSDSKVIVMGKKKLLLTSFVLHLLVVCKSLDEVLVVV